MDKEYEKKYHELEKTHWWFRGRRDWIKNALKKNPLNSKILEIGCSGGILTKELQEIGYDVSGVDISSEAITICKKRAIPDTYAMDGSETDFADETFDSIIASDILEHVKDDAKALSEWNRLLKPNGILIMCVPAFRVLWSDHDEINKHFRRYEKKELMQKIKNAKFEIHNITYWNFFLFLPALIIRTCFKNKKGEQLRKTSKTMNEILTMLLKMENFILKFCNFPIGISLCVICMKK